MFKLNRMTEYGLIALRHFSKKNGSCSPNSSPQDSSVITSAREVADAYGLPFEITAKTLQRLKDTGLIESAHGAKGGYTLRRSLDDVSLGEFLQLMEGPQSVVLCAGTGHVSSECEYGTRCEIKGVMTLLNSKVLGFLSGIRLSELADVPIFPPKKEAQL